MPPSQKGGTPQPLWDRTALYRTEAPPNPPGGGTPQKTARFTALYKTGIPPPQKGDTPSKGWESRPGTGRAPPKKHRSGGARGRGCPKPNAGVSHDPRPVPQALTVHRCCWPGSARLDLPAGGGTRRGGGGRHRSGSSRRHGCSARPWHGSARFSTAKTSLKGWCPPPWGWEGPPEIVGSVPSACLQGN